MLNLMLRSRFAPRWCADNSIIVLSSNAPDYTNELFRNVAMVVRWQVFELPRLETEIGYRFAFSKNSPDHAAYIVAILNGKVQQPPQ